MAIVTSELVQLSATARDKVEAIRLAGALLVRAGCVEPGYVAGMEARERTMSTYLGSGVAIPHGTFDELGLIKRTGISVVQLPAGVEWEDGERAFVVMGIAAIGDEHVELLSRLAEVVEDAAATRALIEATDPAAVLQCLNRAPAPDSEEGDGSAAGPG